MSEDMDLTALVQEYIVSEEKELRELKERLSDVPVSFSPFEEYLKEHKCFLDDLNIRAKFFDPQMRILLLDDMFEFEEADEITEKMALPYPIITINGLSAFDNFYRTTKKKLGKLILPDESDETAKVLHKPYSSASVILYERGDKMLYIEVHLNNNPIYYSQ